MATYEQIQTFVAANYGFTPETCWIAHVKEMAGIPVKRAWNRAGDRRQKPCPTDKAGSILEALRYFGMTQ